jgi:hypothetical protein
MNSSLRQLIPAIVSYVTDRDKFVSKTKLLKLLYLFDIEWYRIHRETYTGFDWMFHLLGPWTKEYDPLLENYYANEILNKRSSRDMYGTEFITTKEQIYIHRLFDDRGDERIFEDLLRTWAKVPTPEILSHVYFRTEPMEKAKRGERLDFSMVPEQRPILYSRPGSGKSAAQLTALRQKIAQQIKQEKQRPRETSVFTPPKYDEEFFEAMDQLEKLR